MKTLYVGITNTVRDYVERLNYEYNVSLHIVKFLMSQKNINKEYLQKYMERAEEKGLILEIAKKKVAIQNKPDFIPDDFTFLINFDGCRIQYNYSDEVQ